MEIANFIILYLSLGTEIMSFGNEFNLEKARKLFN